MRLFPKHMNSTSMVDMCDRQTIRRKRYHQPQVVFFVAHMWHVAYFLRITLGLQYNCTGFVGHSISGAKGRETKSNTKNNTNVISIGRNVLGHRYSYQALDFGDLSTVGKYRSSNCRLTWSKIELAPGYLGEP